MSSGRLGRAAAWTVGFLLAAATVRAEAGGDPVERLERMAEAIRARSAWTAGFQQEYVAAGMPFGEREEGWVVLAWPDRVLFRSGNPPVQLMGLDGRRVRLVDLEVGTCEDHRLSDREWDRIPLVALLEPREAIDRFTLMAGESGGVVLVPREPDGLARITVVPRSSGMPAELEVTDVQGGVNRFTFDEWKPAPAVPETSWLPVPPAGVECFEDPGMAPRGED